MSTTSFWFLGLSQDTKSQNAKNISAKYHDSNWMVLPIPKMICENKKKDPFFFLCLPKLFCEVEKMDFGPNSTSKVSSKGKDCPIPYKETTHPFFLTHVGLVIAQPHAQGWTFGAWKIYCGGPTLGNKNWNKFYSDTI